MRQIQQAGFTLIELLVAITVSGIVLAMVMTSFGTLLLTEHKVDTQRQMQKQASTALIRLSDAMRDLELGTLTGDKGCDHVYATDEVTFITDTGSKTFSYDSITETLSLTHNGVTGTLHSTDDDLGFSIKTLRYDAAGYDQFDHSCITTGNPYPFFWITPKSTDIDAQPKLSVNFEIVSNQYEDVNLELQTTVSSRLYR